MKKNYAASAVSIFCRMSLVNGTVHFVSRQTCHIVSVQSVWPSGDMILDDCRSVILLYSGDCLIYFVKPGEVQYVILSVHHDMNDTESVCSQNSSHCSLDLALHGLSRCSVCLSSTHHVTSLVMILMSASATCRY